MFKRAMQKKKKKSCMICFFLHFLLNYSFWNLKFQLLILREAVFPQGSYTAFRNFKVNNLSLCQNPWLYFPLPICTFCMHTGCWCAYVSKLLHTEWVCFLAGAIEVLKEAGSSWRQSATRCRWRCCDGGRGPSQLRSGRLCSRKPLRSPTQGKGSVHLLLIRASHRALSMKFTEEKARLFVMNAE